MNEKSKAQTTTRNGSRPAGAEQRLKQLGSTLPAPLSPSALIGKLSRPAICFFSDAASQLRQDVFGKDKSPCRLVYGVASLPLGTPVELEVIFEVKG
jgi:enamine deaminase RidA (YjgF/YER057c/UK114 family)